MERIILKVVLVLLVAMGTATYGAVVAQWDFETTENGVPTDGMSFAGNAAVDSANGYLMYGYNEQYGPSYAAAGDGFALYGNGGQDGYTTDATFNPFGPEQWTIETSVRLNDAGGWRTVIGKDGASHAQPESDFYLQKADATGQWRIDYHTAGGQKVVIDSGSAVVANKWYGLAVVSDGSNTTFYVDSLDGNGYQQVGQVALTGATAADNALTSSTFNWTFARGWYNGGFGDRVDGYMDNVRFSDTALDVSELLPAVPEPATMLLMGLGALAVLKKRK